MRSSCVRCEASASRRPAPRSHSRSSAHALPPFKVRIGPRIGRSYGARGGKSPANVASARRRQAQDPMLLSRDAGRKTGPTFPGAASGMRENVLRGPAGEIEPGADRKELEAGGGEFRAALARQHGVELVLQRMQVEHVVGRVGDLRLGQRARRPSRSAAAAWKCPCRAGPWSGPSGRACRCRCGSAARRSWCSRPAAASRRAI